MCAFFPCFIRFKILKMNSVPTLKLRKDIWTHFPVCLNKVSIPSADNRDRYFIQWDNKKLKEWSQNIPFYATVTEERLLKALRQCTRWSVEPARNSNEICVIAMTIPEQPKVHTILPAIYAPDPRIQSIEDLIQFFPVCWRSNPRKGYTSLSFHMTLLRALSQRYNVPESELQSMLKQKIVAECGKVWTVLPSVENSEICRLLTK